MPKSKNPRYLYLQTNSSVWSIRVEPPKELKQLDPKVPPYRKSLGTRDVKQAEKLVQQLLPTVRKNWDLRIQQLKAVRTLPTLADLPSLTQPLPKALDSNLISELLAARAQSWAYTDGYERSNGCDNEDIAEQQTHAEQAIANFSQVALRGPSALSWRSCTEEALDWANSCGYAIDYSDPQLNTYVLSFAKKEFRLQQQILKIIRGEEIELIENYIPPDFSSINSLEKISYSWQNAIDDYKNHQEKNLHKKTLGTELNTINSLKEYLKDKDIEIITSKDIYTFFQYKLDTDNWSNDRVNRHGRNTLKKFFSNCVTHASLGKNPMDSLQVLPQISKKEEELHKRPNKPLNDEQINCIFNSDWYNNKSLFRGGLSEDKGARYWIPLILLFHGFRVTEACQLHKFNIKEYDGIPCFDTRASNEIFNDINFKKYNLEISNKTKSTQRIIPIHPKLLMLGFMEFIEYNKISFFLFPSSIPEENSKNPKIGRAFEQAFLRFIKFKLKFGEGFGNHSFRHLLEDKIRAANTINNVWPAGISQQYMGRSFKDVDKNDSIFKSQGSASDYGYGYPPANILKCIETMDFSKIELPLDFKSWLKKMS